MQYHMFELKQYGGAVWVASSDPNMLNKVLCEVRSRVPRTRTLGEVTDLNGAIAAYYMDNLQRKAGEKFWWIFRFLISNGWEIFTVSDASYYFRKSQ